MERLMELPSRIRFEPDAPVLFNPALPKPAFPIIILRELISELIRGSRDAFIVKSPAPPCRKTPLTCEEQETDIIKIDNDKYKANGIVTDFLLNGFLKFGIFILIYSNKKPII